MEALSQHNSTLKKIVATTLWTSVALLVLIAVLSQVMPSLWDDYTVKSRKTSLDGLWTISELHSHQEGPGHAPYGTYLVLSRDDDVQNPESGYVFFAGYCNAPLQYEWRSNEQVSVRCTTPQPDKAVRTLASVMHGIRVEFVTVLSEVKR